MRNKGAQISIALVCLVLGIMLAIQFKTTESIESSIMPERVTELTNKLTLVNEERDALAEEVISLRNKLQNVRQNDQALADLQEELQKANMAAGLAEIKGSGIVLTLNDSASGLQAGENPNVGLIHDLDLLILVNELKASGAEAISVNGKRIVAMSEVRCAGTTILINLDKIAPPIIIKAIGNPDMLDSGIQMRGGYLEQLKHLGVQAHVQESEDIIIPAYSGTMKFNYALPVENKEKVES